MPTPNITVLADISLNKKTFYCVVSNDTVNSAITWITHNLKLNPVSEYKNRDDTFKCNMNEREDCLSMWEVAGWERKNSLEYKFGPVLDYRWESFQVITTSIDFKEVAEIGNYEDFELPFSLRILANANIYLCDDKYPPEGNCYWFIIGGWSATKSVIRKCTKGHISHSENAYPEESCATFLDSKLSTESTSPVDFYEWKHFILKKVQNTYSVRKVDDLEPFLSYTDTSSYFEVKKIIIRSRTESPGAWKFHSYSFISTKNTNKMQLGPSLWVQEKKSFCLALFIVMCDSCRLTLQLTDQDDNIINSKTVSHEDGSWREIKFVTEVEKGTDLRLYVQPESSNNDNDSFWAIDDVRECTEDSACSANTFGRSCLLCDKVLGTEYCDRKAICELDPSGKTYCTCSAGYKGTSCERGCPTGFYGFGCKERCGMCTSDCSNINGKCNACQSGYSGDTCKRTYYPLLLFPPQLTAGHTHIWVQLQHIEWDGEVSPAGYFVQYRRTDFPNTENWEQTESFHLTDLQPKIITNLTSDISYTLRAILITHEGGFYDQEFVKNGIIKTTCAGISERDVEIRPQNTSVEIIIKNTAETCKATDFKVITADRTIPLHDYIFVVQTLKPYTNYKIWIGIPNNPESVNTSFLTKEGRPGVIMDLKTSFVDATITTVTWNPPNVPNGMIKHYKIYYKHLKYLGCDGTYTENISSKGESITTDLRKTVNSLIPYSQYRVEIQAVTVLEGDISHILVNTLQTDMPNTNEFPKHVIKHYENSLSVSLTEANCTLRQGPLLYTLKLSCHNDWCPENLERNIPSSIYSRHINEIFQVIGDTEYILSVEIQRINGSILEEKRQEKFISLPTAPNPVWNLTAYSKSPAPYKSFIVYLRWTPPYPPTGKLEGYEVKYCCNDCILSKCKSKWIKLLSCKLWPELHCGFIETEADYEAYTLDISVRARNNIPGKFGNYGNTISTVLRVQKPEPPKNLTASWDHNYNLRLTWEHPDVTNGKLTSFIINIGKTGMRRPKGFNFHINEEKLHYYYDYDASKLASSNLTVGLRSKNSEGPSKFLDIQTFSPPKTPIFTSNPQVTDRQNYTLVIQMPMLQNLDEQSIMYVIISDMDTTHGYSIPDSPKIENIFRLANINNPNNSWIAEELKSVALKTAEYLTIGEYRKMYSEQLELDISNRELIAGTNYTITFFVMNSYLDKTRYNICKLSASTASFFDQNEGSSALVYVFALFVPVVVVIIFGFILCRKYRSKVRAVMVEVTHRGIRPNPDVIPLAPPVRRPSVRPKPKAPEANVYGGIKYSKIMKLPDFEAYVKEAIESGELDRQHAMFPRGQTKPWTIGTKPFNKAKNRYNNLAAYDHTRVKLEIIDDNPTTDYINANYIEGYNVSRAYIATQGPKMSTVDDFWRMIWQERAEFIIMLANVCESGKKKTEKYWPDINQTREFGSIHVQYVSVEVFADYEYRLFNVTNNGQERKIKQMHFVSWPDHGVPLYAQSLVPFLRKMLTIPHGKSPVIVHCSAGVGRTGTVILCDICLRMAARESEVDILYHQYKLREQRANMVDNIEQYKLVHLVLLQCLVAPETCLPCTEEMASKVDGILSGDALDFQMKYLDKTAWQDHAMRMNISDETCPIYPEKNRFSDIIPDEMSRVFILPYPTTDTTSSYINAVNVDGFQLPSKYIVTQQPLPNTLGDFWRLVHEKDISVILSLNTINAEHELTCAFWPTEHLTIMQSVPYLTVEYGDILKDTFYDIVSCYLVNTDDKSAEKRELRILDIKNWDYSKYHPDEPAQLLTAVEEVTRLGKSSPCVLITCHDGARASGLFVALSFLIDKIKLEQECDVCQAVRSVRHSRREFVRSREQFAFLYQAALEYVNGFEIYSNFSSRKK